MVVDKSIRFTLEKILIYLYKSIIEVKDNNDTLSVIADHLLLKQNINMCCML